MSLWGDLTGKPDYHYSSGDAFGPLEGVEKGSNLHISAYEYVQLLVKLADKPLDNINLPTLNALLNKYNVVGADRVQIRSLLLDDLGSKQEAMKFQSDIHKLSDVLNSLGKQNFDEVSKQLGSIDFRDYGVGLALQQGVDYERDIQYQLGTSDTLGDNTDHKYAEKYAKIFNEQIHPQLYAAAEKGSSNFARDYYSLNTGTNIKKGDALVAFNLNFGPDIHYTVKYYGSNNFFAHLGNIIHGAILLANPFKMLSELGADFIGRDLIDPLATPGVQDVLNLPSAAVDGIVDSMGLNADMSEVMKVIIHIAVLKGVGYLASSASTIAQLTAKIYTAIQIANALRGVDNALVYISQNGLNWKGGLNLLNSAINFYKMLEFYQDIGLSQEAIRLKYSTESFMQELMRYGGYVSTTGTFFYLLETLKRHQREYQAMQRKAAEKLEEVQDKKDDESYDTAMMWAEGTIFSYLPGEPGYDYMRQGEPNFYPTIYTPMNIFSEDESLVGENYDIIVADGFKANKYSSWGDTNEYFDIKTFHNYLDGGLK